MVSHLLVLQVGLSVYIKIKINENGKNKPRKNYQHYIGILTILYLKLICVTIERELDNTCNN